MDTFARGLLSAQQMIEDNVLGNSIAERHKSFAPGIAAKIMAGQVGFEEGQKWIVKEDRPFLTSGCQEMLENVVNSYIMR